MNNNRRNIFENQTAWFSESVTEKRRLQWKKMDGKEDHFDNALFIFSENADCADTQKIFESEAYRDEHLAVFHARYITDCWKASSKEKIPLGKYFLPPTRIQNVVRKQMKFIWESIDSGVSSDEESDQDKQKTPQKHSNQENKQIDNLQNSTSNVSRQKDANCDPISTGKQKPELQFVKSGKSPAKGSAQDSSIQTKTRGEISTGEGCTVVEIHGQKTQTTISGKTIQKQRQSSYKPIDYSLKSPTRKSPRNSAISSLTKDKTKEMDQSYSLRKKKSINYAELDHINLDNIVLDNTDTEKRQATSPLKRKNPCLDADYFCIEDLPKVTSEMEDMIPGQNGFEVSMK